MNSGENKRTLPYGVKSCNYNSSKAIYHISTARIWIDNCRKNFLYKKKNQFYIQTWHGFALKRIEGDVEDKLEKKYVKTAKKDSRAIDLIVSEGTFMTEIYRRAFWYNGRIEEWGSPRNDLLIQSATNSLITNKVYDYFHLNYISKIVMYAPTFRINGSLNAYCIDYVRLCKACEQRFGGDYVVFVRLHPNIANINTDITLDNKIINASFYPDMQELLYASNIVISDYSSLMFDFALTGKPCFQFAADINEYKNDRNFYFQLDSLPFALSINNDQLEHNILEFDLIQYKEKVNTFFDHFGFNREGKSSKKCVEIIRKLLNEDDCARD